MAREIGTTEFGIFTFAIAVAGLAASLPEFGQDAILTREVARERSRVHEYVANTLSLKLLIGIPVLTATVLAVALAGGERRQWIVLGLVAAAVGVEVLTRTAFATFQAYERFAFIPVVLITQRALTAAVGIVALLAGADVVVVAAIYLGGTVVALFLAFALLVTRVERPRLRPVPAAWRPLIRAALPVGITGVFGIILFRVDVALLAAFEPESVVGEYGAAFRLFETTLFVPWSVAAAAYPVVSRLTAGSATPVGVVVERALKLAVALTLPVAAATVLLADDIVRIVYGTEYTAAASALALLAPAMTLYACSYVAGYVLIARDRQVATTVAWGVIAAQNVVANVILIPRYSLDGAAAATSTSELLLVLVTAVLLRRTDAAPRWFRVLAGPAAATAAAAAAIVLLSGSFAVALAGGAAAYLVVLYAFERLAFPAEALAFTALLRRRAGVGADAPGPPLG